jgi:transcriptional regulator with XRE-family HTH domain
MRDQYHDRYRKLGLNIAYYRKLRDYTQEQLAEKVDIDRTHMSKIEVATVGVSLDMLFAIADVLQVPPKELLDFRE